MAKQNQEMNKSLDAAQAKLAPRLAQMEKSLASLEKQNQAMGKDLKKLEPAKGEAKLAAKVAELEKQISAKTAGAPAKLEQRLAVLEKQAQAQRPAAKGGASAPPELIQRVDGQGQALSGLTTSLGRLQRGQERLEKQVSALATAAPPVKGAPLASPLLAQRLSGLEKQIASLAQAQARPSRQELEAAKRLAELERELARVKKQTAAASQADPKINARLRSLEKQLAADNKDERVVDRRLDLLEKKVSTVGRSGQGKADSSGQTRSSGRAQDGAHRACGPSRSDFVRIGPHLWSEDAADQGVESSAGLPGQALHRGEAGHRGQEVSLTGGDLWREIKGLPALSVLAALAAERGQELWLCGGTLRDLLLDRRPPDLDLAVTGDALALGQALAARTGARFVPLGKEFATCRVVGPQGELDLAGLRAPTPGRRPGCPGFHPQRPGPAP